MQLNTFIMAVAVSLIVIAPSRGAAADDSRLESFASTSVAAFPDALDDEAWFAAITAAAEARGEPDAVTAMTRVIEVIVNRSRAHYWGDETVEAVVKRDRQFSAWNNDSPMLDDLKRLAHGEPARARDLEVAARAMLPIARTLLLGERASLLGPDVLHYANLHICDPKWARGRTPVLVEGAHSFFAGVK